MMNRTIVKILKKNQLKNIQKQTKTEFSKSTNFQIRCEIFQHVV